MVEFFLLGESYIRNTFFRHLVGYGIALLLGESTFIFKSLPSSVGFLGINRF